MNSSSKTFRAYQKVLSPCEIASFQGPHLNRDISVHKFNREIHTFDNGFEIGFWALIIRPLEGISSLRQDGTHSANPDSLLEKSRSLLGIEPKTCSVFSGFSFSALPMMRFDRAESVDGSGALPCRKIDIMLVQPDCSIISTSSPQPSKTKAL
jgi:hypothetical protein